MFSGEAFDVKAVVRFAIHLGVKKEGKVCTRNVEMEKEFFLNLVSPSGMVETPRLQAKRK
jgi:hypothetical protein